MLCAIVTFLLNSSAACILVTSSIFTCRSVFNAKKLYHSFLLSICKFHVWVVFKKLFLQNNPPSLEYCLERNTYRYLFKS